MRKFVFKKYEFDKTTGQADFYYGFEGLMWFKESAIFAIGPEYNEKLLDRALFLAFIILGTSYYKTFPSNRVDLDILIDSRQAGFFNKIYQEGLGQYAFENDLKRDELAFFFASEKAPEIGPIKYDGSGILTMQSGGKDSLLTSILLQEKQKEYSNVYISSGNHHPALLDEISGGTMIIRRILDGDNLAKAMAYGGKNGHVPVTYINQSLALIQAILSNKNIVLASIAHEGEEPHSMIGDLQVNHQWSKTWAAEQLFSDYVKRYVSMDIKVGSIIRRFSELQVAELFVERAWSKYGHMFSSCNQANYKLGADNSELVWCGECPKCANTYLLFAPFLPAQELQSIFGGEDLFANEQLQPIFKGLLGVDDQPKPFECVGEIDELRMGYHMAQSAGGFKQLWFSVPESNFDYLRVYPSQDWALQMLQ